MFWWILAISLVFGVVFAVIFLLNKWEVKIELKGEDPLSVAYGEKWVDPGANAKYQGSLLKFIGADLPVKAKGEVDTKRIGEYRIEYSATAQGIYAKKQRIVKVQDKKSPEIKLTAGSDVKITVGSQWQDGYSAVDDVDGDITEKVKVSGHVDFNTVGDYELTYEVADASGNKAKQVRKVAVIAAQANTADPAAGKNKVIYLTFDDGPSVHTSRLLDILKARNVKASFFVTGNGAPEMIGRAAREGHTIGIHTYTHDYSQVYASDTAFWADYARLQEVIKAQTGQETRLMRFPGGSSNTVSRRYSSGIMSRLVQQASAKGYVYFDWNVSSGDASGKATKESVLAAMKQGVQAKNVSNILCHDTHGYTVDAIPEFLDWALANGYTFLPLAAGSLQVHHSVAN